jgi:hypothetical protein
MVETTPSANPATNRFDIIFMSGSPLMLLSTYDTGTELATQGGLKRRSILAAVWRLLYRSVLVGVPYFLPSAQFEERRAVHSKIDLSGSWSDQKESSPVVARPGRTHKQSALPIVFVVVVAGLRRLGGFNVSFCFLLGRLRGRLGIGVRSQFMNRLTEAVVILAGHFGFKVGERDL